MFKKYNKCIYCDSSNLKKEKKQNFLENFYIKAIRSDLNLSKKQLGIIKVYKCGRCHILQNNPWFFEDTVKRIYSNIYGQHNRSWSNLINFIKKGKKPNHGLLYNIIKKKIKIRNYAEYNSPFMGLFINFFEDEYKKNRNFYKNFSKNIIKYLISRQVAGKSKNTQKLSSIKAKKFLNKINLLKRKKIKKRIINKYLFVDNSSLSWGQNDNYKSVNSKSYATEIFDLKTLDLNNRNKDINIDLFGIFHTLDHTFKPNKVLNFALDISKYVVVYCHIDERLNKQHLFSLTKDFLKYLNKKKVYSLNLTKIIDKKFFSPELYFVCSRQKKCINKLAIDVNKKN